MRPQVLVLVWLGLCLPVSCSPPGNDQNVLPATDGGLGPPPPPIDATPGCVTTLSCQARTAEHQCGVTTATGQRYPDRGAPFCSDRHAFERCECDLVRCATPAALCPGTYKATFRERLIAGCDGTPGQYTGTCPALRNQVELLPGGLVLATKQVDNTDLGWDFGDISYQFTLTAETPVRLAVSQYCWLADVQGPGDAGRAEISQLGIVPAVPSP